MNATTHSHVTGECETFVWIGRRWCVTHALELVEQGQAERLDADITGLDSIVGLNLPEHTVSMGVRIDKDHAGTVDLSRPILYAALTGLNGDDFGHIVLDGWHRVYRARSEGIAELPAYLLTAEAEQQARINTIW